MEETASGTEEPLGLAVVVADERSAALAKLLGVPVEPGFRIIVEQPQVTSQWYVDNPTLSEGNEAVWWSLSRPDRIVLTRSEIREAIGELNTLASEVERKLALERHRGARSRRRQPFIEEIPGLVAQRDTALTIAKALRRTSLDLELIHERLRYKFARPTPPEETNP